jgi:mannose-6-phosphate isomerase-like protein (cupin superfamily)
MKRVVTGHDENGKAIFVKIGEPEHVVDTPGVLWKELWATYPDDTIPVDATAEPSLSNKWKSVFPDLGESRVRVVTFDPSKSTDDIYDESVMNQRAKALPGLMEHMEPENEGMHTTDSVDYGVVISGNPKLELDDGETVDLEPGDIVIQNGTRHAWRFKDDEITTMLWVLIGTKRN